MTIKGAGKPPITTVATSVNDVVIDNNDVQAYVPAPTVLIRSQSDLASLPNYPAGTMAYTAGFAAMWQKSVAGEWISMI